MTVPSVVQLPFTLTFFFPSFSQNIQSGLNIILSGSRDLWRSEDEDSKERQSHTEKAHRLAFDIVKSLIERFVILGKSVVKLNELREIYREVLSPILSAQPRS
jgi:hypothetical protein